MLEMEMEMEMEWKWNADDADLHGFYSTSEAIPLLRGVRRGGTGWVLHYKCNAIYKL